MPEDTEIPASKKAWNPTPKQAAFLAAYRLCGNITRAAAMAGVHPDTPRCNWKGEDGFDEAMGQALEEAVDHLEEEARRRAQDGVDEPVYYKGSPCGAVRKYSDTLLIFLLKGARPQKFRENVKMEHGGEVNIAHAVVVKGIDTEAL